jgi:hypothetical protein
VAVVVSDTDLLDLALDAFADRATTARRCGTCAAAWVSATTSSTSATARRSGSGTPPSTTASAAGHRAGHAANEAPGDELDRLRAILVRYVEVTAERSALIRIINHEAARPGGRLDHVYDLYIAPPTGRRPVLTDLAARAGLARVSRRCCTFSSATAPAGSSACGPSRPVPRRRGQPHRQAREALMWCCGAFCLITPYDTYRPVAFEPVGPRGARRRHVRRAARRGDEPLSIWMMVKSRDSEGDVVWGVRSAGEPLSSEELLGRLTGSPSPSSGIWRRTGSDPPQPSAPNIAARTPDRSGPGARCGRRRR